MKNIQCKQCSLISEQINFMNHFLTNLKKHTGTSVVYFPKKLLY